MKKIITLSLIILSVAILLTTFTSCNSNKKPQNVETEEYIAAVTNGEFSFTAEVGETSTIIKNNGQEFQTLQYPVNAGYPFDYAYAKERSQFIDMNFDGQPDFYIAVYAEAETIYYYCWLYNVTTQKFDYSVSLSGLTNISVDADTHTIYSTYTYAGTKKIMSYRWVDGKLEGDVVYDNVSDTIPVEVTKAAEENVIGSVARPALTTKVDDTTNKQQKPDNNVNSDKPESNDDNITTGTTASTGEKETKVETEEDKEETKAETKADVEVSTTKENKPLGTTTTAPYTYGIQIETGNINDGWY